MYGVWPYELFGVNRSGMVGLVPHINTSSQGETERSVSP